MTLTSMLILLALVGIMFGALILLTLFEPMAGALCWGLIWIIGTPGNEAVLLFLVWCALWAYWFNNILWRRLVQTGEAHYLMTECVFFVELTREEFNKRYPTGERN